MDYKYSFSGGYGCIFARYGRDQYYAKSYANNRRFYFMGMKLEDYILPGDRQAVAKEIEAERECIERAVAHLLLALKNHGEEDFSKSYWEVYRASQRIEDFFRSRDEIVEASKRWYDNRD